MAGDTAALQQIMAATDQDFQWGQEDAAINQAIAARKSAGGGINVPVVLPIPVNQKLANILNAAGLIFSGGNVATIDITNPIKSLTDLGTGLVNTVENIFNPRDISGGGTILVPPSPVNTGTDIFNVPTVTPTPEIKPTTSLPTVVVIPTTSVTPTVSPTPTVQPTPETTPPVNPTPSKIGRAHV